ncbi:MAG: GDSL-like Lipase/Acylhydrolase family [Actinomycetota bacterium]
MKNPVRSRRLASVAVGCLMTVSVAASLPHPSPATALPATPNGQGALVVIGDSLMEGSSVFGNLGSRLTSLRTWTSVAIDHKRGRKTSESYALVKRRLAAAKNPTAIVIALGTNDMISHGEPSWPARVIERMMVESKGLPVLWVNTSFNGAVHPDWKLRASRFNRILRAARAQWPNLFVADWSGYFVPRGPSRYIADGVHLTVSGYKTRAAWLTSQIRLFGTTIVNGTTTTTTIVPTTSTTVASTTSTSTTSTSTTLEPTTTSSTTSTVTPTT